MVIHLAEATIDHVEYQGYFIMMVRISFSCAQDHSRGYPAAQERVAMEKVTQHGYSRVQWKVFSPGVSRGYASSLKE